MSNIKVATKFGDPCDEKMRGVRENESNKCRTYNPKTRRVVERRRVIFV